jgi:hypothetical protein
MIDDIDKNGFGQFEALLDKSEAANQGGEDA